MSNSRSSCCPSTFFHTKLTKYSLLDLSSSEQKKIMLLNVINGFSLVSAIPSAVETAVSQLTTMTQMATLGTAAKIGQVCTLGGLGVIGAAAGAYYAHKQINDENEKIIRMNKEFFLMFNIAADKWEAFQAASNVERKREDKVTEDKIAQLEYAFYQAVSHIQVAISSPLDQSAIFSALVNKEKYPNDVLDMAAVIQEYARYRISEQGKTEKELWFQLKYNDSFFREDKKLLNYFLDYSNEEQAKEYFQGQMEAHIQDYSAAIIELSRQLQTAQVNIKFKEEQKKQELKDYNYGSNNLIILLKRLRTMARAHSRITLNPNIKEHPQLEIVHVLELLKQVYDALYTKLEESDKQKIGEVWEKKLLPLIKKADDHFKYLFNKNTQVITSKAALAFGENGTFRQFWRQLPTKTYTRVNPYTKQNESIPLNFEQNIHRGGAELDRKSAMIAGGVTFMGLCTTGKGLYVASVALGATAIGSTGVGLIVVGIALALTLLSVFCYYRTKRIQSDRDKLAERLNDARNDLFALVIADKKQEQPKTFPPSPRKQLNDQLFQPSELIEQPSPGVGLGLTASC